MQMIAIMKRTHINTTSEHTFKGSEILWGDRTCEYGLDNRA